jgi:bZIP transcription factor
MEGKLDSQADATGVALPLPANESARTDFPVYDSPFIMASQFATDCPGQLAASAALASGYAKIPEKRLCFRPPYQHGHVRSGLSHKHRCGTGITFPRPPLSRRCQTRPPAGPATWRVAPADVPPAGRHSAYKKHPALNDAARASPTEANPPARVCSLKLNPPPLLSAFLLAPAMVPRRARAAAFPPNPTPLHAQPVLYRSSALAATCPELAFRRRTSARIAAAAAQADACRDKYKLAQEIKSGCADAPGDSAALRDSKKYRRRLLLNRHSAGASRLRKEAYVGALEKELAELESVYEDLKEKVLRGGAVPSDVRKAMVEAELEDGEERLVVEDVEEEEEGDAVECGDGGGETSVSRRFASGAGGEVVEEEEDPAEGEDSVLPSVGAAVALPVAAPGNYLSSFHDDGAAFDIPFPMNDDLDGMSPF